MEPAPNSWGWWGGGVALTAVCCRLMKIAFKWRCSAITEGKHSNNYSCYNLGHVDDLILLYRCLSLGKRGECIFSFALSHPFMSLTRLYFGVSALQVLSLILQISSLWGLRFPRCEMPIKKKAVRHLRR